MHAPPRISAREWLTVSALSLVAVAIFFNRQIALGFALIFNVGYDTPIEIALMQHWNNVLHGREAWNVPSYFFPHADTLGYNDGYVIYGVLYTAVRAFGIDPYLSAEIVHMLVKAVAVPGMFLVLRTIAGCRFGWSLVGAIVFAVSNNSLMQAGHAQLLSLSFIPLVAFLFWRTWLASIAHDSRRVFSWGIPALLFFCSVLFNAYYMAWYFGLFASLLCAAALITSTIDEKRELWATAKTQSIPILTLGVVLILGVTPFLYVYLPKAGETGMHLWINSQQYALHWFDLINVGPTNIVWGAIVTDLYTTITQTSPPAHEFRVGFPLVFLGLAMAGIVKAGRERKTARLFFLVAAITLVTWALTFRYAGVSPWVVIFKLFPGAKGTRVIARYQLFLTFPLTILITRFVNDLKIARVPALAIAIFLIVEQVNPGGPTTLRRRTELAMLQNVPPIPADCASFYVITARDEPYFMGYDDQRYAHNVDAMMIAAERFVPTIIGYASFNPPDWRFDGPMRPDYEQRVHRYIRAHALDNVCSLNVLDGSGWKKVAP